jgi:CRP-like cAMP-binding protein
METLTTVDMLEELTDEQKQQFLALGETEFHEPGAVIFGQGDEAQKLYIVEEGRVAIEAEVDGQKRVPICTVSKGEIFGWSALVPPYRLTASAISLEKTKVLAIEGAKVRQLCSTNPVLGCAIMRSTSRLIASRLRNLRLELISIIYA